MSDIEKVRRDALKTIDELDALYPFIECHAGCLISRTTPKGQQDLVIAMHQLHAAAKKCRKVFKEVKPK